MSLPLVEPVIPQTTLTFKYDLTDVEDTINGEGLAITGTIDANKSSTKITLPTKSAATTYTSAAGVTLRLLSVLDDPDLEYRLGSSTELKVAVNSATKASHYVIN